MPSNGWKIVSLQHENGLDLGLTRHSRLAKILPHRFLEQYDRSLYIDANLKVAGSLQALFARLDDHPVLFFRHPEGRSDIYTEAEACIRLGKEDPVALKKQMDRYRGLGFAGRASEKHATIPAGMAILRRHNDPSVQKAMEAWWSEYIAGSRRDQLSLPFALHQTKVNFDLIDKDVRRNEWFVWQPHYNQRATKIRLAAYQQASAILLHVPGAETRLKKLLVGSKQVAVNSGKLSKQKPRWLLPKPVLFDDNILGVSPHGAPPLEIAGSEALLEKPVALLCDDPSLQEAHAISSAQSSGVSVQDRTDISASYVYGIERRLEFERMVKTFLQSHRGPKAILYHQSIEQGDLTDLYEWLRAQGKLTWPVRLRSMF